MDKWLKRGDPPVQFSLIVIVMVNVGLALVVVVI